MRQTYETRERLTVKRTAACVGLLTAVMTLVGCKQNTEAATGPEPSGVATATASPTYEATIPPTQRSYAYHRSNTDHVCYTDGSPDG